MGTNYYLVQKECTCCGRHEKVHIGKRSGGWMFSFHAMVDNIPNVRSWKDWQREIKNNESEKPIINEYDERLTFEKFFRIVEESKNEKLNHFDYCIQNYAEWAKRTKDGIDWKDEEGWAFCATEFS